MSLKQASVIWDVGCVGETFQTQQDHSVSEKREEYGCRSREGSEVMAGQ